MGMMSVSWCQTLSTMCCANEFQRPSHVKGVFLLFVDGKEQRAPSGGQESRDLAFALVPAVSSSVLE